MHFITKNVYELLRAAAQLGAPNEERLAELVATRSSIGKRGCRESKAARDGRHVLRRCGSRRSAKA